jgi:hypothetical protein
MNMRGQQMPLPAPIEIGAQIRLADAHTPADAVRREFTARDQAAHGPLVDAEEVGDSAGGAERGRA